MNINYERLFALRYLATSDDERMVNQHATVQLGIEYLVTELHSDLIVNLNNVAGTVLTDASPPTLPARRELTTSGEAPRAREALIDLQRPSMLTEPVLEISRSCQRPRSIGIVSRNRRIVVDRARKIADDQLARQ